MTTWHCTVYSAHCITTQYICGVVLCPHKSVQLSGIEESARTLAVLDVDGYKERFDVKNTHTTIIRDVIGTVYIAIFKCYAHIKAFNSLGLKNRHGHWLCWMSTGIRNGLM